MSDFSHILNWKLLFGSHKFPGPDGGTCINEAAVVACGFPYQRVSSVKAMPACFSRPICRLAMQLNDNATDAQRQRLMPFVTRLACADTPEVEHERERYIDACLASDNLFSPALCLFDFQDGLSALEGALAIGRQADPLGTEEAAGRLDAARASAKLAKKRSGSFPVKVKGWLGLQQTPEDVG
ncbi:hypothetical protein [Methylobacterium longum]|uniref:Uncharacterized protein n=1 Tax=Methylobacterium longum TaxID=767694 RepID=A0ABT8AMA5_9HYPH|nr:hypothetical protein [Methylobacterium longum]MDN3571029.1 hypothetical protein [Methylobacterium longum]GJE15204.1 hypothetical protein FOHLNKBM_6282 [Methylobacterium longum]